MIFILFSPYVCVSSTYRSTIDDIDIEGLFTCISYLILQFLNILAHSYKFLRHLLSHDSLIIASY